MSESDNEEIMIMMEPGFYLNVTGIAIGTAETMGLGGCHHKHIVVMFLDSEGKQYPFLLDPNGTVFEYLMSDEFRQNLTEELAKIT